MLYFFLVTVPSNWSPLLTILHIPQLEWPHILVPASLSINYFNLERSSLSVIAFGFQKVALGGDGKALWNMGDFRTFLWGLRRISHNWFSAEWYVRTSVLLSSVFCLVFKTKQLSLTILFFQFLKQHDPVCTYVLLTFLLIAQDGY